MAPFNKRQIGYIQAVAGRQQHTTLVSGQVDGQISSQASTGNAYKIQQARKCIGMGLTSSDADAKSLLIAHWTLDDPELCHDARADHNNAVLEAADVSGNDMFIGCGTQESKVLRVFHAKCAENTYSGSVPNSNVLTTMTQEPNDTLIPSTQRATPDGYLRSTDIRFRFTIPSNPRASTDGSVGSLFPTADQLGITNTDESAGLTVTQYESFVKGVPAHPTNPSQGTIADTSAFHAMINQWNATHPMGQDHYEFRWIVWRNKHPTVSAKADNAEGSHTNLEAIRDGASFRNPGYDLFVGQTGRKRGFIGYTKHPKLDSNATTNRTNPASELYSGQFWNGSGWANGGEPAQLPTGEDAFTVDDLMTMRLNRDDYVVMKDVRFFLGKEHGKSHFEDTLHWDWNDPIDTNQSNVLSSTTLNNKNFRWHMTLIGTTNGKNPVILNQHVRWTTKMESG
jgi:hypothetical protein